MATTSPAIYGRSELMVIAAVRYCLGRSTYIVGDCCEWLEAVWPTLDERTRYTVRRDIEEAFLRDDEDRKAGRERPCLGMDMDRREWQRVRALWAA